MISQQTIRLETDLSDEVLTVRSLRKYLLNFDQNALILFDDESVPIHLEIHKIIQADEPGCTGTITTVYLVTE